MNHHNYRRALEGLKQADKFFREQAAEDTTASNEIISPRPITVQVQHLSAETMRECDEIMARANRRNIAATIELETVTEGHARKSDAERHE